MRLLRRPTRHGNVLVKSSVLDVRRKRGASAPTSQSNLRLFLSSANVQQFELWHNTGIFHGITTNPIILESDGVKCNVKALTSLAQDAFELGAQEMHLQVWGDTVQKLSSVAFDLAGINPRQIVIKLPCTLEGIQTATLMRDANIRITIAGINSAAQVVLAEAVGAEYASAYFGWMIDKLGSEQAGMESITQMHKITRSHNSSMRLMVSSIRDASDLAKLSEFGCDTFTISPAVAMKMFMAEGTLDYFAAFEDAARRNS
ncbi:hypothetical protein CEUSTIGMA_g10040.t1 [Chlamydomonas eustigma]|uniref:Transaldolase n=1 Tax=Chlamydomonas eustigma TaxID=1157962 RepID=A0A250XHR3_9CHLO|nr:hypothetical protein CEUSTIGMA_g10040.t1 [Chlamydomonas eustigma]|eukprot:GAX82614.1 hypothetical protein CEUSTIGMA_g10040.t1 [Chlamydomonas eustigma]